MDDLKPCPFCGGSKSTPFHSNFLNKEVWAVFCEGCQTEGPHHFSEAEAVDGWNTRCLSEADVTQMHQSVYIHDFRKARSTLKDRGEGR